MEANEISKRKLWQSKICTEKSATNRLAKNSPKPMRRVLGEQKSAKFRAKSAGRMLEAARRIDCPNDRKK